MLRLSAGHRETRPTQQQTSRSDPNSYFARWARQRSEQYFTSSQTLAHFFRQAKGRLQVRQVFCGRSAFFCILATQVSP